MRENEEMMIIHGFLSGILAFLLFAFIGTKIGLLSKTISIPGPQVSVNCPEGLNEKDYLDLRAKYLTLTNSYLSVSSQLNECSKSLKVAKEDLSQSKEKADYWMNYSPSCEPCPPCEEKEEE